MKKFGFLFSAALALLLFVNAGVDGPGYKVGDTARDFKLKNIDGNMMSLSDIKDAKGYIVIFTCNHCPYAVASEDRIIALDKKYKKLGFPVVAIQPNDTKAYPSDNFENMKKRAQDKGFTFPYLIDESQEIAKSYGATKTPHVYLLDKNRQVQYIGAIDNSVKDANSVTKTFLADAIDAMLAGKDVPVKETKAIGCSIKWKES